MGIARVRPSRNSYEVNCVKASMPDGVGKSYTIEITNIPNRGIIRSFSLYVRDATALSNSVVNMMVISTTGAATSAAGGDAGMDAADADKAVLVTAFKISDALTGSLDLTGGGNMFIIQADLLASGANGKPPAELYYDVSSGVLGPDASDGKLYITLISGGFDFAGEIDAAKVRLEIEPCF